MSAAWADRSQASRSRRIATSIIAAFVGAYLAVGVVLFLAAIAWAVLSLVSMLPHISLAVVGGN